MVLPRAAAFQPLVQQAPGGGGGGAVPGGLGDGGHCRGRPGLRVRELEHGAVPGPPPARGGRPCRARRGREVHHPVAAQPACHFDRQVAQQPGQPGQVIAGVEDHQDVRVAVAPVPGSDQAGDDLANLGGGHRGRVVGRAEADRIQRQRPGGAARLQRRHQRVRPARDHLRVPLPPRIAVAEQPLRAGRRVRPQPVAHIRRQPDPPVRPGRQRQARQRPPQPPDLDLAAVHRVIYRPVAAAALRLQRQLRQHVHPVLLAQQRIRHLEQHIGPPAQAPVQLPAEPRQQRTGPVLSRPTLDPGLTPRHTERHGHRIPSPSSSFAGTRR